MPSAPNRRPESPNGSASDTHFDQESGEQPGYTDGASSTPYPDHPMIERAGTGIRDTSGPVPGTTHRERLT
jgi:hypothetical protein